MSPYAHLKVDSSDDPRQPVLRVRRYKSLDGPFWLYPTPAPPPTTPPPPAKRAVHNTEHSLNWIDDEDLAGDFDLVESMHI